MSKVKTVKPQAEARPYTLHIGIPAYGVINVAGVEFHDRGMSITERLRMDNAVKNAPEDMPGIQAEVQEMATILNERRVDESFTVTPEWLMDSLTQPDFVSLFVHLSSRGTFPN